MDVESFVKSNWNSLMNNMCIPETVGGNWWSVIARRYGEEWRFYHTLSHIQHMLQLFHQWKEMISDPSAVALAIFFHDIVYDPQASDNEIQSIRLFGKFALDAHLAHSVVSKVSQMIKSTITHSVEGKSDDLDLCLFLDFDLAVLGQEKDQYKMYAKQIRQEYIHVKDEDFKHGRGKVLRSLLNSPSLYASEAFSQEYEEQARANIAKEIDTLSRV
ncbi:hypothetical protein PoB_002506800 [Plakobranchus ocellatus]|uniref:HD domain-containing protein n=1 Tax=Plakobranchus ocellatus TaxID=259542 RepID=A0AAV3ZVU3_9GAST|nr:hypothetical protein PoB_002506800 [Plakobranchus ocellatus]